MRARSRSLFLLVLIAFIVGASGVRAADNWTDTYDRLLKKYVSGGGVKYAAWKSNAGDLKDLEAVVDGIGSANIGSMARGEQLAFYINAYNAWILHEALDKYPTKSVKDTFFSFFTSKRIKVAGEQTSFNALEKETIRSKFGEPRVHFALNCASQSCPPLSTDAFRGGNLEAQLEKLSRNFVNTPKGVAYQDGAKTAELSKIFDWYKDDFKDGGPVAFINKRRSKPLPNDVKISYQDYNWGLNEVK
jgi:hypothetical protein